MRQIELQADQALAQGLQLPYAMIRSYSQVTMGNTPTAVDLTEVIEARFFNAETEVRLFRKDGKLCGAKLCGECGDIGTEESFRIENPEFGSELKVSISTRCFPPAILRNISSTRPQPRFPWCSTPSGPTASARGWRRGGWAFSSTAFRWAIWPPASSAIFCGRPRTSPTTGFGGADDERGDPFLF